MRLELDGRATGALDEDLHRLYVLTNAMRRSLPMHIYENVISVVTAEDALPVRSVPAREVELVHSFEDCALLIRRVRPLSPLRSIPGAALGRARLLDVGEGVRMRANR